MAIQNSLSNIKIAHRNWEEALANAFAFLVAVGPGEMICITGPSRVGKTRLIKELIRLLVGEHSFEATGILPAVVVEAVNSGPNGSFSTKSFTLRLLEALRHPLLSTAGGALDLDVVYKKLERTTEATLRVALENALAARQVKYLFIDECQHMRYASKDAQGAYAVMDSYKCLAQTAGVILVVVGAYPILQIIRNSPHLVGRKHQVDLPRYRFEVEDLREFASIIIAYERYLNICPSLGQLVQHIEYLHSGTEGCIGLLRAWLLRAQAMAEVAESKITMSFLQRTRLSDDDLVAIGREIQDGEKLLQTTSLHQSDLEKPKPRITSSVKNDHRKHKPFQKSQFGESLAIERRQHNECCPAVSVAATWCWDFTSGVATFLST